MDDIEKIMVDNQEFKQSVEQLGQALQYENVAINQDNSSPPYPANNNDSNTSDAGQLYRSLDSDRGNMEGNNIPDSLKSEVASMTQIDIIEMQQSNEISAPSHTPTIKKQDNELER